MIYSLEPFKSFLHDEKIPYAAAARKIGCKENTFYTYLRRGLTSEKVVDKICSEFDLPKKKVAKFMNNPKYDSEIYDVTTSAYRDYLVDPMVVSMRFHCFFKKEKKDSHALSLLMMLFYRNEDLLFTDTFTFLRIRSEKRRVLIEKLLEYGLIVNTGVEEIFTQGRISELGLSFFLPCVDLLEIDIGRFVLACGKDSYEKIDSISLGQIITTSAKSYFPYEIVIVRED